MSKIISLTGRNGFFGKTLKPKLEAMGYTVYNSLVPEASHAFLFGAVSSHEQFKLNPDQCWEDTISTFIRSVQFCRDHNIRLVYPSSITVKTKESSYAHCKAALEEIQAGYNIDSVGLRIVAGYGPNESHKGYYASVLYKFCKDIKAGIQPVIWGDGSQTRDFIYQDDAADWIIKYGFNSKNKIEEIGTGINTSFTHLIDMINKVNGSDIQPVFVDRPATYVQNSFCDHSVASSTSLEEGIRKTLESL